MISTSTIESIRNLPIEEVIGRYVDLNKKGKDYQGLSPFNEEKSPSFSVSTSKNIWKCFSSGYGGTGVISFVMKYKNLSYPEAIEEIAASHNIIVEYERKWTEEQVKVYKKQQQEKKELNGLLEWAAMFYASNEIPEDFTKYRAFRQKTCDTFSIGATSSTGTLLDAATQAGYSTDLLIKSGLISEKNGKRFDAFRNRVIFPIHDHRGNVVAFTGRIIDQSNKKAPKYFNSPDSIWTKGDHLYGLHLADKEIHKNGFAYLVEGNPDVLRCHQRGLTNTVAPCGTSLTADQIRLLKRYTDEVVILPDNDLEKKDNPGISAMHKNTKLLLQNGFTVKVCIPGTIKDTRSTDPDEYIKKLRTTDQLKKWLANTEDYISAFLLRECMSIGEQSAKSKTEQIKRLAEVLEVIPQTTLRDVYYDEIGKEWYDFKRKYKLKKREEKGSSAQLDKLKKDDKEDFFDYGFWEQDGCYFTMGSRGQRRISRFTIDILYFISSSDVPKYVCKFTNVLGRSRIASVTTDDFTAVGMFKKIAGRLGNFIFEGNDDDLNKIKLKLFNGVKEAFEPRYVGYNPGGEYFTWANGIHYNGAFYHTDKYGMCAIEKPIADLDALRKLSPESHVLFDGELHVIIEVEKWIEKQTELTVLQYIEAGRVFKLYYYFLPFAHSLKISGEHSEDDNYQFERHFRFNTASDTSFHEWSRLFVQVYGDNGVVAICYYIMAIYRDLVFNGNNGYIPILGFFGMPKSGKSTCARSLCNMFGTPPQNDGLNLESGATTTGVLRYLSSMQNCILWLNEYKNSISDQKRGMIKGIADGTGKLTGRNTGGNETKSYVPKSAVILCGQDLPTQDAAILSRTIPCEFDKEGRNQEAYHKLITLEKKQVTTNVTAELLQYRKLIKDYYQLLEPATTKLLKEMMSEKHQIIAEDRDVLNLSSILVPVSILMQKTALNFPFSEERLIDIALNKIKDNVAIQHTSNDVEKYFHVVASCVGREVYEGTHFKIDKSSDGITRLHLRINPVHPFYRQAAIRQQVTPLDTATIRSYLQKHGTYLGSKPNERLKNLKNGTSTMVFNYDKMVEQGIEFYTSEDLENLPPEPLNGQMAISKA